MEEALMCGTFLTPGSLGKLERIWIWLRCRQGHQWSGLTVVKA